MNLYLNDLRNARKWDFTENIDTLLIESSDPDLGLRPNGWSTLVSTMWATGVPYRSPIPADKLHHKSNTGKDLRDGIYVVYAITRVCIARCRIGWQKLASYIYHYAVKRGLMDLMKFAHENGADTSDGFVIFAAVRHVRCLRLAGEVGGSFWYSLCICCYEMAM